jgi:hypothetical protein
MEVSIEFVHREGILTNVIDSRNNTSEAPRQGACTSSKSRRASFPCVAAACARVCQGHHFQFPEYVNVLASPTAFTQNFTLIV